MRQLLKIILVVLAAVLAVAVGIVIFWLKSDPSTWRDALARLASEQLGRQLTIAGELKPGFSFAHGLTLEIADLRLANAPDFQSTPMLVVPKLEVTVDLRALFSNTIHIRGLKISSATLSLAQTDDGTDNWTFHTASAPPRIEQTEPAARLSDGRVFTFDAQQVTVNDLLVNYTAPGDKETVQITRLELEAPASQAFKFNSDFQYNQTPYQISFTSRPLKTLLDGTLQPIRLDLKSALHHLAIEADYSRHENLHRLGNLQANVDRLALKGEATVTIAEPHPHMTLKLATPLLDLPKAPAGTDKAKIGATAQPEPLFSRTPLPWSVLSSLDLDGVLDVERVVRGNEPWGPLHIGAQLAHSRLDTMIIAQPPGAAQPMKINLAASANQEASLTIDAPALNPVIWSSVFGDRPIVQSPASIALSLSGRGAALHDLASTAQGTVAFTAQPGLLNPVAIPEIARRALDAMIGPDALDKVTLACLKANFNVQDGIMHAAGPEAGIGLDSNILALSGDGQADLGAETIALRLVAVPKLPGLTQTLLPLHVTGALSDPRISADLAATAGQAAGQLIGRLADALPSVRLGLAAAKAAGQDPTVLITQPHNPCLAETKIFEPTAAPDATTAPSQLPPEVQQKLKGARDMLDQFIKATEAPASNTPQAMPAAPVAAE